MLQIYKKKEKYLIDVSLKSIEIIYEILEINLNYKFTNEHKRTNKAINDSRKLSRRNKNGVANSIKQYRQVFEENHGFINNLSMIDLIFNQGIGSLDFFEKSNI